MRHDLSNSILQICRRCEANQQGCTRTIGRIFKITHIRSVITWRDDQCFFLFFLVLAQNQSLYHVRLINQNKRGWGAEGLPAEGGMQLIHLFVNEWVRLLCPASPSLCLLTDIMVVQTDMILQHQQMPATQAVQSASLPGTLLVPLKVLMALTLLAASPQNLRFSCLHLHLPCDLFATPRLEFSFCSGFSCFSCSK